MLTGESKSMVEPCEELLKLEQDYSRGKQVFFRPLSLAGYNVRVSLQAVKHSL